MFGTGIQINLSIDSRIGLFFEVRGSLLRRFISLSFDSKSWKFNKNKKPYVLRLNAGPFHFAITDISKLDKHIDSVLKENKDKFYSES